MRSGLFLSLALVPPMIVAAWTWILIRKAEKNLGHMTNFEGMHFED
ncbi:MAG: hypothetical protein JF606_09200 [Burkholderiales bacterium]|jgi:hypothetical protein|nr:hypothetical protein [Burkholderiales bacterium]